MNEEMEIIKDKIRRYLNKEELELESQYFLLLSLTEEIKDEIMDDEEDLDDLTDDDFEDSEDNLEEETEDDSNPEIETEDEYLEDDPLEDDPLEDDPLKDDPLKDDPLEDDPEPIVAKKPIKKPNQDHKIKIKGLFKKPIINKPKIKVEKDFD